MFIKVNGKISKEEAKGYIRYIEQKYNRRLKSIEIIQDENEVDLNYTFEPIPFERIRRITGYLVGTIDSWNDAKRAEEKDRVSHMI